MMRRQRFLAAALAATLALAGGLSMQPPADEVVAAAPARVPFTHAAAVDGLPAAEATAATGPLPLVRAQPLRWPGSPAQRAGAWGPPPPAPAPKPPPAPVGPPLPPPRPQAPPFPYQWIGRLDDGAGPPQALLAGALRTIAARAGDTIDGSWRIDKVDAAAVQLTWLPGPTAQTLRLPPL